MAWHLPFDLTSSWERNDPTVWLLPGQGTGPRVWILSLCYCCQPSHSSQTRSREIRILCSEKTIPLSDSCFVWADFFFPEGKSSYITTKTFFLFNFYAAGLLWSHCVGPWRAVSRMIPGRSRNPSWKYIFFLGFFPRIPHRELWQAGRRMDGLGSSPISAVEVSWSPSRADDCLQSTKPRLPPQRPTHWPTTQTLFAKRNSTAPQERAQTRTSSSKTAAGPANTNSFSTSIIRGFHQHVEPFVLQK